MNGQFSIDRGRHDAIVVGAGLSGMMAALCLAIEGKSVLIVDRRSAPGGKCGTFECDGYRFTIGCNDFGGRIARDLASVGVEIEFAPSTMLFDLGDRVYRIPPNVRAALQLIPHAPSILRTLLRIRAGGRQSLGELFDSSERGGFGFRLVSLLAYALGTPPQASVPTSPCRLFQAIRLWA